MHILIFWILCQVQEWLCGFMCRSVAALVSGYSFGIEAAVIVLGRVKFIEKQAMWAGD